MSVSWDILISSLVHRTDMLVELLEEFERQREPNVGVIVFRDNTETIYGEKCQRLLEASEADYVSFFDDDDWPEPDFIAAISEALRERPDYVGFNVHHTEDGRDQAPVYHSLQHGGWSNSPGGLLRDIVHFNPIRREHALAGRWEGGCGADARWAEQVRASGGVQQEVYLDRILLHYRHAGGGYTVPQPMADPPPQPDIDWVTWL
jgi:glycosyltransferase involved in cell wall biosynthesis